MAQIHLKRLYKQAPLTPGDHTSSTESKLGFQFFIQVQRIPLVLLVLPLVHLVLVLVHLVLVLVPLVLVSSSCNPENREREEESGGGAGSVGSSSTLYFCSNWFVLHRSLDSSIHNPEFFITFFYIQVIYWIPACIKCSNLWNIRVVINRLDVVSSLAITWNCIQSCGLLW